MDNYLDEFHNSVKDVRWENNMLNLVEAAVEFFEAKGFRVYAYNQQL